MYDGMVITERVTLTLDIKITRMNLNFLGAKRLKNQCKLCFKDGFEEQGHMSDFAHSFLQPQCSYLNLFNSGQAGDSIHVVIHCRAVSYESIQVIVNKNTSFRSVGKSLIPTFAPVILSVYYLLAIGRLERMSVGVDLPNGC